MFKILRILIITFYSQTVLAQTPTILVFGDSLSAGYKMAQKDGWVELLKTEMKDNIDLKYRIVNASISGDTTSGGLQRLPIALDEHNPDIVIIELGANDGLRGQSLKNMRQNLTDMVKLSQNSGAKVLLLGVRIPSNYGEIYTNRFYNIFAKVADRTGVALMPFFLEPLMQDQNYFQADNLHPNESAQPVILDAVWPYLEPLLE